MSRAPRDLGARLFRAARLEEPADAARQRTLAAMLAEPREPDVEPGAASGVRGVPKPERALGHGFVVTGIAVSAAAALVFVVLHARREDASISASPEPPRASSAAETSAEPLSTESPPAPATETARPRPAPTPPRSSPETPVPPPSLSEEVQALDAARQELAGGRAADALRLLDRYDAMHGRRLADEATLLRIEALVRAGKRDAARGIAERFVEGRPNSPLADRARALVAGAPKNVPPNGENP